MSKLTYPTSQGRFLTAHCGRICFACKRNCAIEFLLSVSSLPGRLCFVSRHTSNRKCQNSLEASVQCFQFNVAYLDLLLIVLVAVFLAVLFHKLCYPLNLHAQSRFCVLIAGIMSPRYSFFRSTFNLILYRTFS